MINVEFDNVADSSEDVDYSINLMNSERFQYSIGMKCDFKTTKIIKIGGVRYGLIMTDFHQEGEVIFCEPIIFIEKKSKYSQLIFFSYLNYIFFECHATYMLIKVYGHNKNMLNIMEKVKSYFIGQIDNIDSQYLDSLQYFQIDNKFVNRIHFA